MGALHAVLHLRIGTVLMSRSKSTASRARAKSSTTAIDHNSNTIATAIDRGRLEQDKQVHQYDFGRIELRGEPTWRKPGEAGTVTINRD